MDGLVSGQNLLQQYLSSVSRLYSSSPLPRFSFWYHTCLIPMPYATGGLGDTSQLRR